jgi:hypothetical protein
MARLVLYRGLRRELVLRRRRLKLLLCRRLLLVSSLEDKWCLRGLAMRAEEGAYLHRVRIQISIGFDHLLLSMLILLLGEVVANSSSYSKLVVTVSKKQCKRCHQAPAVRIFSLYSPRNGSIGFPERFDRVRGTDRTDARNDAIRSLERCEPIPGTDRSDQHAPPRPSQSDEEVKMSLDNRRPERHLPGDN